MVVGKDLTVMQVRPNYSIVYQFKPTIRFEKKHLRTKDNFIGYLKDTTLNWKTGDYFIKCDKGSFCYFSLNGRSVKLLKKSKITGKDYLCWQYFLNSSKR
jgi:hypothetical protein